MACKCNKDNLKNEFIDYLDSIVEEYTPDLYEDVDSYTEGVIDNTVEIKKEFYELWQEHMEEDDA